MKLWWWWEGGEKINRLAPQFEQKVGLLKGAQENHVFGQPKQVTSENMLMF